MNLPSLITEGDNQLRTPVKNSDRQGDPVRIFSQVAAGQGAVTGAPETGSEGMGMGMGISDEVDPARLSRTGHGSRADGAISAPSASHAVRRRAPRREL